MSDRDKHASSQQNIVRPADDPGKVLEPLAITIERPALVVPRACRDLRSEGTGTSRGPLESSLGKRSSRRPGDAGGLHLGPGLGLGPSAHQCLGLSDAVGQQLAMMVGDAAPRPRRSKKAVASSDATAKPIQPTPCPPANPAVERRPVCRGRRADLGFPNRSGRVNPCDLFIGFLVAVLCQCCHSEPIS